MWSNSKAKQRKTCVSQSLWRSLSCKHICTSCSNNDRKWSIVLKMFVLFRNSCFYQALYMNVFFFFFFFWGEGRGGILAEPINSHRWEAITGSLNAPSWVILTGFVHQRLQVRILYNASEVSTQSLIYLVYNRVWRKYSYSSWLQLEIILLSANLLIGFPIHHFCP